jgi:hypothetical protein
MSVRKQVHVNAWYEMHKVHVSKFSERVALSRAQAASLLPIAIGFSKGIFRKVLFSVTQLLSLLLVLL